MRSFVVALMLLASTPALSYDAGKSPGEQLDGVLEDVLGAIGLVLKAVPQYELPEVLPNGDIIIRRVRPEEQSPEKQDKPAENGDKGVKT